MALNELSPKKIENAKPKDADYKLTDGGSLYLLVKKNGTKAWRMNYRFNGKQATLALGVYPDVPLATARKRRDEARQLLADGRDPREAKRSENWSRYAASLPRISTAALLTGTTSVTAPAIWWAGAGWRKAVPRRARKLSPRSTSCRLAGKKSAGDLTRARWHVCARIVDICCPPPMASCRQTFARQR
ncbi:phage integrase family protein [Klebsiella pneumoniae]|nr:phage integrase family protein [Klebsiella pneumoniae]